MTSTLKPIARIESGVLRVEVTSKSATIAVTRGNDEPGVAEALLSLHQFAVKLSEMGIAFETSDRKTSSGRSIDFISLSIRE
jgi:hypothetical protein